MPLPCVRTPLQRLPSRSHRTAAGLAFLALVVGLAGPSLAWAGKRPGASKDKPAAPPMMGMPVEASVPEVKTVYKKLKATGTLYPQQEITVTSEIAGRINQLPFKEGELIHKNDLLISLKKVSLLDFEKQLRALIKLESILESNANIYLL